MAKIIGPDTDPDAEPCDTVPEIGSGNPPRIMTLNAALHLLTQAHTREDARCGFTVEWSPRVEEWGQGAYIEAWKVVREYLMPEAKRPEDCEDEPGFP